MARKNRFAAPGLPYHVVNRGNDRKIVFRQDLDYIAFIELLAEGVRRHEVFVFGYCMMPNHFHLLIEPRVDGALSAFMQWVTGGYACTFRRQTNTVGHGHVFQRRFWNAAIYDDAAFLAVLRYIEANPVRASLVADADLWPWSSFTDRAARARKILSPLPLLLPPGWSELVSVKQSEQTLGKIRSELTRTAGRPSSSTKMGQALSGGVMQDCDGIAGSYKMNDRRVDDRLRRQGDGGGVSHGASQHHSDRKRHP
jgi:putative transposase